MELSLNISYASSNQSSSLIGLTLHQLLEKRVDEHPDREMYVLPEDGERITFEAFKDRVEKLAAGLLSIGMKKGDPLAIWGNIHMETLLFIAAARSIGVITVRILPAFPNSSVKDILIRTGCKVIVLGRTPNNLFERLEDIRAISTDDETKFLRTPLHIDAIIGVGKNNKSGAYNVNDVEKLGSDPKVVELFKLKKGEVTFDDDSDIFITSGSTGKPKFVVHTHFSVINGTKNMFFYHEGITIKGNRRIILGLNTAHVIGEGSGVMPPLVASMTSVFAPSVYNIKQIVQTIQNERCTDVLFFVNILYDMLNFKDIGEYDVTSLDICLTGGSNIHSKMASDFEEKFGCKVLIAYASTESLSSFMCSPLDPLEERCSGVRIMPNTEIQLVDDDGKCVPIGSNGEIWCRSYGNFQRYMGNDEQTKAVKSPHGWYKTGDLGVFNAAGVLSIVGRIKDVIIRGGINIFPADIENILVLHPSIDQVQVIGVPDERLSEEICICIRTKKNASVDRQQIIAYLNKKVREQGSIPGYVLIFESFPRLMNGKIDRTNLTKQAIDRIQSKVPIAE